MPSQSEGRKGHQTKTVRADAELDFRIRPSTGACEKEAFHTGTKRLEGNEVSLNSPRLKAKENGAARKSDAVSQSRLEFRSLR